MRSTAYGKVMDAAVEIEEFSVKSIIEFVLAGCQLDQQFFKNARIAFGETMQS
jgi:hypothetical protein